MAAMIRRAYTLKAIQYNDYQSLVRTMQRRSIWKKEPLDDMLTTAEPNMLRAAVMMLLEQKVFSAQDLIDELECFGLSIYPTEIEEMLCLPNVVKLSPALPAAGV